MSKYIYIVLFLVATATKIVGAQEACSSTGDNSCVVYTECIEKQCRCNDTEYKYPAEFGVKYCGRFGSSTSFTDAGEKWRDKTLSCLKDEISRAFFDNIGPPCNCEAIQKAAVDSHSLCYTRTPSVCDLPDEDIREIANIVDRSDITGLGIQGVTEIWVTFVDCYGSIGVERSVGLFAVYLSQEWDEASVEAVTYVHGLIDGAVAYAKTISNELSEAFEKVREAFPIPTPSPK